MTEKPYPQNHPHYIQGVYAERERIIALLERLEKRTSNGEQYDEINIGECIGINSAIRAIKGENE